MTKLMNKRIEQNQNAKTVKNLISKEGIVFTW